MRQVLPKRKLLSIVDVKSNQHQNVRQPHPGDMKPPSTDPVILAVVLWRRATASASILAGPVQDRLGAVAVDDTVGLNIASAHGLVASPFKAAYVAAKHGIVGLTKVAALETAEEGITCNAICPGYVCTPLVEAQIDGQAKVHGISREAVIHDVLLAQQPNKRFATVEELGALTVFLADDAAASITGIALPVDGRWTAH
jgi:NAD(P)-dependent dehydrogenase (short-subunit alcohol dehydrogenase family)